LAVFRLWKKKSFEITELIYFVKKKRTSSASRNGLSFILDTYAMQLSSKSSLENEEVQPDESGLA
jgi:hypothetical protein